MATDYEYLLQFVGLKPSVGSWTLISHGQPAPPKLFVFWRGSHRETAEETYLLALGFSEKTNRYYFLIGGDGKKQLGTICEMRIQTSLF